MDQTSATTLCRDHPCCRCEQKTQRADHFHARHSSLNRISVKKPPEDSTTRCVPIAKTVVHRKSATRRCPRLHIPGRGKTLFPDSRYTERLSPSCFQRCR